MDELVKIRRKTTGNKQLIFVNNKIEKKADFPFKLV